MLKQHVIAVDVQFLARIYVLLSDVFITMLERTDSFLWAILGNKTHQMSSRLDLIRDWPQQAKVARYSASTLARICCVSPRHLNRYLQERMHQSTHNWLREMRMGKAVELITLKLPLKEAALELCYKNTAHFTRDFKDYYGVTPGQFLLQTTIQLADMVNVAFRQ